MCFGDGGSDNGAMIREQKAQATDARQKEVDRQARLQQGLANIKAAFEGGNISKVTHGSATIPAYGSGAALPAGYSWVQSGGTPAVAGTGGGGAVVARGGGGNGNGAAGPAGALGNRLPGGGSSGGDYGPAPMGGGGTAGTPGKWMVRGPDGALHEVGSTVGYDSTTTTNAGGGFGEDFYNRFRQGVLDNFMPQVSKQYKDAKTNLTYDLARAGTGRSSVATEQTADLAEQNANATGDVISKADTATGDLRSRVAGERAKAEAQLYATEDPDVASNQALAAVNNISLARPEMSTLGELFKTAAIGSANAIGGYRNQTLLNKIRAGNTDVING